MVHHSFGRDDAQSFQARLDAAAARNDLAKDHAEDFVGMNPQQAQAHADELGLTLRLAPIGTPVTMEYRYGRVNGWLRDDVIVEVTVG